MPAKKARWRTGVGEPRARPKGVRVVRGLPMAFASVPAAPPERQPQADCLHEQSQHGDNERHPFRCHFPTTLSKPADFRTCFRTCVDRGG